MRAPRTFTPWLQIYMRDYAQIIFSTEAQI